jgi:hypothetical protein
MINFNYTKPNQKNPNGNILVSIENSPQGSPFPFSLPLSLEIYNQTTESIIWENTKMFPGTWSSYPWGFESIVYVKDSHGSILFEWKWDPILDGDVSHKFFLSWAMNNRGSRGIAIGTHDGCSGEWVHAIRKGYLKGFLVEASVPQYMKLVDNYKNVDGAYPILSLVTPEGGYTAFFEGGEGHTNSTIQDHTNRYIGEGSVSSKILPSRSINSLILELGMEKDLKWLHLDVEGIDADLIMSLDEDLTILPEIIIYESLNLTKEKKEEIGRWLSGKSYYFYESGWNTICYK